MKYEAPIKCGLELYISTDAYDDNNWAYQKVKIYLVSKLFKVSSLFVT